jgi:hypothetical protein
MKPKREMEDPSDFAVQLSRLLRLNGDEEALGHMEDVILDAMNEALDFAREAARTDPRWSVEAIDALKTKLNA